MAFSSQHVNCIKHQDRYNFFFQVYSLSSWCKCSGASCASVEEPIKWEPVGPTLKTGATWKFGGLGRKKKRDCISDGGEGALQLACFLRLRQ